MKKKLVALLLVLGCAFGLIGLSACELPFGTSSETGTESSSKEDSEESSFDDESSSENSSENTSDSDDTPALPTEGLEYTLSNDGTYYSVTGIGAATDTDIVIPSTYNDLPVQSIGDRAFYNCYKLTSIEIPDSVQSIGASAFRYCRNLTNVEIPDGVQSIGEYAFNLCSNLTSVTIGNGVQSIGDRAFFECYNLTSVYITDIAAWCAIDFESMFSNPLYCANDLYVNNVLVTELVIPGGVQSIGASAFVYCDNLTSVTIGNGVQSIGEEAFFYCDNLTSVTIGNGVQSIGEEAFSSCPKLASITVAEGNEYYASQDGNLYNKDKTVFIQYAIGKTETSFEIPDSVQSIGEHAFHNCYNLTSIEIPDSVQSIGAGAFRYCDNLTSIEIPDSVQSIGKGAFYDCENLTSVTIGNGVKSIGDYAFIYCSKLTSVTVAEENEYYASQDGILYNKEKTEFIHIPQAITGDISIPDGVQFIGESAFSWRTNLTSIEIPDSVESIGARAFSTCENLTSVTIGNGVQSIGEAAFFSCSKLASVYYEGTATEWQNITIGGNNSDLTSATIYYSES